MATLVVFRWPPLGNGSPELIERRLRAMRTAVLGSEATVATLQEELLATEAAQVTLGQLVKSQAAEGAGRRSARTELDADHRQSALRAHLPGGRCPAQMGAWPMQHVPS